jgi:pseudouridylate synthase
VAVEPCRCAIMTTMLRVAEVVRAALDRGDPVVALESTVLTHGVPRPDNLALAERLEAAVAAAGAVPATVGVIGGVLTVGLSRDELARLASGPAEKATLWNLAGLLAEGADAGTTVAATLRAATLTGIRVFATGGLGGVHAQPFDESADLAALSQSPVITVCSGPKSVLDVPATLERLETAGVPVVGWRSDRLAGFLTPLTELPLPLRADSAQEVARIEARHRALAASTAVVVSNPVAAGLERSRLAAHLETAQRDAREAGVRGKDVTPFLLERLAELSEGASVEVNMRVLEANAALAADIAVAVAGLAREAVPAAVATTHAVPNGAT